MRIYLRKMAAVPLLTRASEVAIAKRIEEGQRRVLEVVLGSAVAIEEILLLRDNLRQQKIQASGKSTSSATPTRRTTPSTSPATSSASARSSTRSAAS